jgi:uncharacterized protein (DUF3820 family)
MSYILNFGKHKNKSIETIYNENPQYLQWLYSQPTTKANKELYEILESKLKNKNDYYMSFGKYKNKGLSWIIQNDSNYIIWLRGNKYVKENLDKLYKIVCAINI